MPDSKPYLHPEAISRITRLEMRARHIVEGFLSGMHRSPYFGQSIEFLQHREYVQGDDPRHVDWKVWAKQERFYIKQYEEETNLRCLFLVDVSKSMQYQSGALSKYDYGCTAAVSLAYLLLKQQDAVACVPFDDRVRAQLPFKSTRQHLMAVIESLKTLKPTDKTGMFKILKKVAETYPRRGMVVLISDLLTDRDSLMKGLRLLRQRGHDVLILHIMDDEELDFPFQGPTRFEGLESDDLLNCNPRALREGYLKALEKFLEDVRIGCAKNVVDYKLIRTSEPLDAVLATFLSNRLGMHHRN
ncbi:VWFA domain-containing protein [Planctomycetales bacterium 10988]|nr:VWFA domain-containing protein [Planctomycetales bacterium 10988]